MLNRITKILLKPHLIPLKLLKRLEWLWIEMNYDYEQYETEQIIFFNALGLDYLESKKTLVEMYDQNKDLMVEMKSCHHNLFTALSKNHRFENILEIGTHSGAGAVLLSILFPDAQIETIDLPDNHPVFKSTYGRVRESERRDFINRRNDLLSSRPNITFNQTDSTSLSFVKDKAYDFIWVDGDHEYPLVAIDIVNSLRLLNTGGLIACDDVRLKRSATYETIQKFVDAKLVKLYLIHKRTIKPHASLVGKYVAILSPV